MPDKAIIIQLLKANLLRVSTHIAMNAFVSVSVPKNTMQSFQKGRNIITRNKLNVPVIFILKIALVEMRKSQVRLTVKFPLSDVSVSPRFNH